MFFENLKNKTMRMLNPGNEAVRLATAAVILLYIIFICGFLWLNPGINYYSWRYFMTGRLMSSFSTVFLMSLCWHSWCISKKVINNYVNNFYLRKGLLILPATLNLSYLAYGLSIIWDIFI